MVGSGSQGQQLAPPGNEIVFSEGALCLKSNFSPNTLIKMKLELRLLGLILFSQ